MIRSPVDPSPWTAGFATLVVTMCVTAVAGMDRFLPLALGGALPLLALAAAAVNALGIWIQLAVARIAPEIRPAGLWKIVTWAQGSVLATGAGMFLGMWTTRLQSTLLGSTPRAVIIALIAAVAVYALVLGFETTMRMAALVGVVALPVFLLLALTIPVNARWDRLFSPPHATVYWPAVAIMLFAPRGYVVLGSLAGPRAADQPLPSLLLGIVGSLLLGLFLLLPGLVFGHALAASYTYPFYQATATVRSIFVPFHEAEYFVDVLWQMIDAVIVATYLAAALRAFGDDAGAFPRRWWGLGALVAMCLAIAAPTLTQETMAIVMVAWSLAGLLSFVALPLAALASRRAPERLAAP